MRTDVMFYVAIVPAADPCQYVGAELRRNTQQLQHAVRFLQVQTFQQRTSCSLNKDKTDSLTIFFPLPYSYLQVCLASFSKF